MSAQGFHEFQINASTVLSLLRRLAPFSGAALKGSDGVYEAVDRDFEILFDQREGQVAGKSDKELFPAEVAEQLGQSDQQVRDGHAVVQVEACVPLGQRSVETLWTQYPLVGTDGRLAAIGVVVIESPTRDDMGEMRCSPDQLVRCSSQLRSELIRLEREAGTDRLTGTWNRRRFEEALVVETERFKRYGHPLCLMIIDIDYFKGINDGYGHVAGDNVLTTFARVIQGALRVTDSLTRWGGDEFIVLSPETDLPAMSILAERLRGIVRRTTFPHDKPVTISIGVAERSRDEDWEDWFLRADRALYRAKESGRNQVQCCYKVSSRGAGDTPDSQGRGENLVWRRAYECGHRIIDDQHRALFHKVNSLLQAILDGRPNEELESSVDRLVGEAAKHFEDEEKILAHAAYLALPDHAAKHATLIGEAGQLLTRLHSGSAHIGEVFVFLAHDLVARHLLSDDRGFFPLIRSLRPDVNEGR